MPAGDIRPLSFGELLDRTFTYYRKHFWTFAGIMTVPQLCSLLQGIVNTFLFSHLQSTIRVRPNTEAIRYLSLFSSPLFVGVTAGFLFLYMILGALAYGAVTNQVSEIQHGRTLTIRESYNLPLEKLGS